MHLPDGLRWDVAALFSDTLERLQGLGTLDGIGVDAWGCDYASLDGSGRICGLPFHYRDLRAIPMIDNVFSRISREELYAITGIQTMPINTVFQLLADRAAGLAEPRRIALVADLFNLWLTGHVVNEATAASTTGLLDAQTGGWAQELVQRLGLPVAPFEGDVVEPGTELGPVLHAHEGLEGTMVRVVASHDTASAFVAAPLVANRAAVISSGTWSLVGLELETPVLTAEACAANLSNERGFGGTTRLLRNVMGLWLAQQCRRQWEAEGISVDYAQLETLANEATRDVALFDPDNDLFLPPGDMPARIRAVCLSSGQAAPTTPGETMKSVFTSLACKYRYVLQQLERVSSTRVETIHVIGGGARSNLLNELTAEITGCAVMVGPIEATAIGNVLVQAHSFGALSSLEEMRAIVVRSFDLPLIEPRRRDDETYERFLDVTNLRAGVPTLI